MKTVVLLLPILCLMAPRCSGLRCLPCDEEAKGRCPLALECPFGTVKGICNCCDVCAKGTDEECGGIWDLRGKCGRGLRCKGEQGQRAGKCVPE